MADTGATEAPALSGDGLRESILDDLRRHIGEGLLEFVLKPQDDLWIRVSAATWAATGRALRAMGFEYFCFLSAIDWKPSPFGRGEDDPTQPPPERPTAVKQGYAGGTTRFQVFARVTDTKRHVGVTLKVDVDDEGGDLAIDSWHAVYAGANWHERETHEMYGISFTGHPDLRNMYLPTDFEGYPLRKDFPLLARMVKPWPGIVDVEPMPVEETAAEDAGDAIAPPVADRAVEAGAVDDGAVEAGAVEAGAVEDADAAGDAGGAVGQDAPEVDGTAGADESGDSVSANLTGAGASADAEPRPASVSGDVTDSGASADTESESVAPPTAEEVEAAGHDVADEDRVADEAAADDTAVVESAEVEAVTIEPGATDSGAPIDPASTEDAGPESEAAEHPESAANPADATEETVGDAPDHSAASDDASDAGVTASAPDPSADDPETGDGGVGAHPGAEPDAAP